MDSYVPISGILPPPDKSGEARATANRLGIGLFAYGVISTGIVLLAGFLLTAILGIDGYAELSENPYYVWGLQVLAMYGIALPALYLLLRRVPRSKIEKRGLSLGEMVTLFLISEAVMTAGALISNYLTGIFSFLLGHDVVDRTSELVLDSPAWIVILVAVVIGPIAEELIFRHGLIPALKPYGDKYAIIVSAVAFGIFHGNFNQMIYATALGLIFGYVYVRTGSVWYGAALHVLLNLFGTVPTLLATDSLDRLTEIMAGGGADVDALTYMLDSIKVMDVALLQYGLTLGGIIAIVQVVKNKKIAIPSNTEIPVERSRLVKATLLNVGALLFLALCAGEVILSLLP